MIEAIHEAVVAGARLVTACAAAGISTRTVQRWRRGAAEDARRTAARAPANKLSDDERRKVLATLNSPEFRNLGPAQVVPRLADAGSYLASESTMYRLLRDNDQVRRRDGTRSPTRRAPRAHVATAPNQVWCWDISYLPGPRRGGYFFLYLVLDLFSRRIMAAEVHTAESADLAGVMIQNACAAHGVDSAGLVLHSDNGGPMKGATMLETLRWLGITPSFSRPHVSDDNAYVEALFRTAKYRPGYSRGGFASLEAARTWVGDFTRWYNEEHRHSGLRFVTPLQRYMGADISLLRERELVYLAARDRTPRRWSRGIRNWTRPPVVRLNKSRLLAAA